ncbi:hypothetical protein E8E13_005460 [Curvularia kusanoi]|uniref:Heterokaryon incompatibility domain-containing protein n=1 Tax=Curvularia kusanoi TaxID=90978 RepID=A0A9P4T8X3_CURKU|nr:hypothetical protein E8E13_005460 [Curvularia kusanoi]
MDLLRGWIDTCNNEHAGVCHTFADPWARIELTTNLHFIDVEQRCLVNQRNLSDPSRYVALSYVWGTDKDPLQTLHSNVEAFSQAGAFCTEQYTPPLTILDSMEIVRSLGLKYLWVDRFCIIQDDETSKTTHLAAMASIYANAYFTIAACDGDASSGLAGSTAERQREAPYERFKFGETCQMLHMVPTKLRKNGRRTFAAAEVENGLRATHFHNITIYLGRSSEGAQNKQVIKDIHWWEKHPAPVDMDHSLDMDHSYEFVRHAWKYPPSGPRVKCVDAKVMDPIQQHPMHIRLSTQHLHAWVVSKSDQDHKLSSLPGYGYYPATRDLYLNFPRPFLFTKGGDVVGHLETDFKDVAQQCSGRNESMELDLICIGGLEFEWNLKVATHVSGARFAHLECEPDCALWREFCKFGPDWKFRFYNVLWVEWKDGVAYRKGIGKIWADCWDKLCPQPIDVVLG